MATRRWTARRRRALEAYVTALKPVLRLADWTITFDWETPDTIAGRFPQYNAVASITPMLNSKHATLRVAHGLLEMSAVDQTQVLCHELVHCHLFALVEATEATFGLLKAGERRVAELALHQQVEFATDALADAFAPLVPLFDVDGSRGR